MVGDVLAAFKEVSKIYGERKALDGLTMSVHAGEVVGLLGPNGAGKTTALRILCGLMSPDHGQVSIAGHDLARAPIEAKKNLGYVPDGAPLYANLTPREHLELVGRLHGLSERQIHLEGERLLEGFELLHRADEPVGGFSRGMRQKAAIACALLPRPALLVLDEPLTGLEPATTLVIKALLREWADRSGAALFTSHSLEVVEQVCDRMAILVNGRLLACGTMDDLRRQAGRGNSLAEVFLTMTKIEDPAEVARRILGA